MEMAGNRYLSAMEPGAMDSIVIRCEAFASLTGGAKLMPRRALGAFSTSTRSGLCWANWPRSTSATSYSITIVTLRARNKY